MECLLIDQNCPVESDPNPSATPAVLAGSIPPGTVGPRGLGATSRLQSQDTHREVIETIHFTGLGIRLALTDAKAFSLLLIPLNPSDTPQPRRYSKAETKAQRGKRTNTGSESRMHPLLSTYWGHHLPKRPALSGGMKQVASPALRPPPS